MPEKNYNRGKRGVKQRRGLSASTEREVRARDDGRVDLRRRSSNSRFLVGRLFCCLDELVVYR
jgi:hypothetical protein